MEGGFRVPCIVRWPGHVPEGKVENGLMSGLDWLPTLAAAAGYFAETTLGAVRIDHYKYRFIDQPGGWLGGTVKADWPFITNLRLDPYEWFKYAFWRFVFVQKEVEKFAKTFIEYPPVQKSASFNMDRVKEQIVTAIASHSGK